MSLELSKEMLTVEGYLTDASLIFENKVRSLGFRSLEETWEKSIIEIAKMLQIERQHNLHKKPKPENSIPVPQRRLSSDSLMSSARKHPKLPPMVSADEVPAQPKRSHTRKTPVEVKASPRRVRKPKAKPKQKSSRRS
jgi:hypothetical protein